MTNEQRAIMDHVVVDPAAWYAHAAEWFGEELALKHLKAKVATHKEDYDKEKVKVGYKNRIQREDEAAEDMLVDKGEL